MGILDCTERHIYDLIVAGELIAIKIGSQGKRISENSLNEFIEKRKIKPEDFFDPEKENITQEPASQNRPVAKSNWMRK
jgi:hypothetical protein